MTVLFAKMGASSEKSPILGRALHQCNFSNNPILTLTKLSLDFVCCLFHNASIFMQEWTDQYDMRSPDNYTTLWN